jgi:hypothetical protein
MNWMKKKTVIEICRVSRVTKHEIRLPCTAEVSAALSLRLMIISRCRVSCARPLTVSDFCGSMYSDVTPVCSSFPLTRTRSSLAGFWSRIDPVDLNLLISFIDASYAWKRVPGKFTTKFFLTPSSLIIIFHIGFIHKTRCVRCQVITVASIKLRVFWDVLPCS